MSTTTRVFWDDTEKRKVAEESFRILRDNKGMHHMQAIEKAQRKVLKAERQRPTANIAFTKFKPWIEPMWHEIGEKKDRQSAAKIGANDLFTPPITKSPQPEAALLAPEPAQELAAAPAAEPDQNTTVVIASHGRRQVHWTDDEKHLLALQAHHLLKSFEDMKPLEALRKAIESELPEDRQREISTLSMVEWFIPAVERVKLDEQIEAARLKEEREVEARIAREAEERIEREARAREEEIERRVNDRVDGLSFDSLIRAFARKLARDTLGAMREELRSGILDEALDVLTAPSAPPAFKIPMTPMVPEAAPVAAPKLPKVMVVGLFPNQEADVEKAFRGSIEFEFVKTQKQGGMGEGGHGMLNRSRGCDVVLAMSDSAGLDVEQKRKQLTVPFRRIAGSSSNLKRWLTMFMNGEIDMSGSYSDGSGK